MPGITHRRSKVFVGVYDENEDEDEVRYCRICKKLKFELVKLIPLILDDEDEQEKPPDYNRWLQCPSCGKKYKKRDIRREARLTDFVEVDDDDDESDNGYVGAVFKRGRKTRLQRYVEDQELQQAGNPRRDPDALAAIKKGLNVTNYKEYQIGQD